MSAIVTVRPSFKVTQLTPTTGPVTADTKFGLVGIVGAIIVTVWGSV